MRGGSGLLGKDRRILLGLQERGKNMPYGLKPVGQVEWGGLGVPSIEGKSFLPLPLPSYLLLNTCTEASERNGHLLTSFGLSIPNWGRKIIGNFHFRSAYFSIPPPSLLCGLNEEVEFVERL